MYVVMGATGHVGRAVAEALLEAGDRVTALSRDAAKATVLAKRGARVVEADVREGDGRREAFRSGRRAFLLNPPADVAGDTDAEERETVRCILSALDGSGLERVVAESVIGARPGEGVGDLTGLYGLEEGLRRREIPAAVIRAAYYMSNWDAALGSARERGEVPTMFPADLKLPMVAPADIGRIAADLLRGDGSTDEPTCVEGPERYSTDDVAAAFGHALDREVKAVVTPRDRWLEAYRDLGFSDVSATAYARMTAVTIEEAPGAPRPDRRGATTIEAYVRDLAGR